MAQKNEENNKRVNLEGIEYWLEKKFWLILTFIFLSIFMIPFFLTRDWMPNCISYGNPSEVGDTFGGIMAPFIGLFTISLIFLTYRTQRRELRATQKTAKQQAAIMAQQQFENTFFELLKVHRENTEKIRKYGGEEEFGRRAFASFKAEFEEILKTLYFNDYSNAINNRNEGAPDPPIIEKIPETPLQNSNDLNDEEKTRIAYLIFYFGVTPSSQPVLTEAIKREIETISTETIKRISSYFSTLRDININGFETVKFSGQQSNLSHYFRNLFQTITFVAENNDHQLHNLNKHFYIKKLRAQMSYHELAIFFANSITYLGSVWEWQFRNENPKDETNKSYITDFELLKNLPENSIIFTDDNGKFNSVDHKQYYPGIFYEDESLEAFGDRLKMLKSACGSYNPLSIARSPNRPKINA